MFTTWMRRKVQWQRIYRRRVLSSSLYVTRSKSTASARYDQFNSKLKNDADQDNNPPDDVSIRLAGDNQLNLNWFTVAWKSARRMIVKVRCRRLYVMHNTWPHGFGVTVPYMGCLVVRCGKVKEMMMIIFGNPHTPVGFHNITNHTYSIESFPFDKSYINLFFSPLAAFFPCSVLSSSHTRTVKAISLTCKSAATRFNVILATPKQVDWRRSSQVQRGSKLIKQAENYLIIPESQLLKTNALAQVWEKWLESWCSRESYSGMDWCWQEAGSTLYSRNDADPWYSCLLLHVLDLYVWYSNLAQAAGGEFIGRSR